MNLKIKVTLLAVQTLFIVGNAKTQTPGAPWFLENGIVINYPYREPGGGKLYSFADTDGLAGEEFTFVRNRLNNQDAWEVSETGGYWTINGGSRLGDVESGNLTLRLSDGENTIRYYTNDSGGIGYQIWYVVPPMLDIDATVELSHSVQSHTLDPFPGTTTASLKPHNMGTDQADFIFKISTDSGINAIHKLAVQNGKGHSVGGCLLSGTTATCNISLKSGWNNPYTASLSSWRMDSRGNQLDATFETKSNMSFILSWNLPPEVEIAGGSQNIVARDGKVSMSASASDPDGTVTSTEWLVGSSVVATGTSAEIPVTSGYNEVTFRATDIQGESLSTSVKLTVNNAPVVAIAGGDRSVADTNANAGERVSVSAMAADSDGNVSSTEWLVGGSVAATGTSANLSLGDGATVVTFRATDNQGAISSRSATITVAAANARPTVLITGGDRSVADTDGNVGESVSVSAIAADSDGSVSSTEWLVGGTVVATGNSANLSLSDGANSVTFKVTDNSGDSSSAIVTITVAASTAFPTVSISGGNRSVADTDGKAGEAVSVSATATDSNGIVSSTDWLIGSTVVATGTSTTLSLDDGATEVTFRATDNDGNSTSASVKIAVAGPDVNAVPSVLIAGGDRTISDSDRAAGEVVSVSGTATDSDGSVSSTEWLVGGAVVATGTSANLSLSDGATSITFRATDNDGDIASSTATVTVSPPSSSNLAPAITVSWGNLNVADTDGRSGEAVSFSATASDLDGSVISTQWLVGSSVAATGTSANLQLGDGATSVTFRATDDDGESSSATVTVNVLTPAESNPAPIISLIEVTNPIGTTSQGDTTILDSNDSPGEKVFVSATAVSSDGRSPTAEWLVNGSVVATGQTAHLSLSDGINAVMFRATNNGGGSASTTVALTVSEPRPPNVKPVAIVLATVLGPDGSTSTVCSEQLSTVVCSGARTTVADSDGLPGEMVSFSAAVSDSDGKIVTTEWKVSSGLDSEYVAAGTSVGLRIPDGGAYQVVLKVIDDSGGLTLAEVFVEVVPPSSLYPPKVEITYAGANPRPDSDGLPGEKIDVRTQATDDGGSGSINRIISATLLINGEVFRVSDLSDRDLQGIGGGWDLTLQDGVSTVTYQATDIDGEISSDSVTITIEPPNASPVIEIAAGDRSIADTDGADGETVSLSATAADFDGTVASFEWLVANEVIAQGTSAELFFSDGATVVTFRATDDEGAISSTNATITVAPNLVPEVIISGGDRSVEDSDGVPGETISLTATASDADGSIGKIQWSVSEEVLSNGPIVIRRLTDGPTEVTFTATDDHGVSTSARVTINVLSPNVPPTVSILGGSRSIGDSDGIAGEIVSVSATAVDSDGRVASTEWLVGGEVVATGTFAKLPLNDGTTTLIFRSTDDDGEQANTSVTITVSQAVDSEEEFSTDFNGIPAPSFLSGDVNTVSVFDMAKLKLRSCIKLTLNGQPYLLDGHQRYDMNFNLVNMGEATFNLVKFRPFNVNGSLNQFSESPDCSGQFELSTNAYKDIVAVPTMSEGGNLKYNYYNLILDLSDIDGLLFKLRSILIIREK